VDNHAPLPWGNGPDFATGRGLGAGRRGLVHARLSTKTAFFPGLLVRCGVWLLDALKPRDFFRNNRGAIILPSIILPSITFPSSPCLPPPASFTGLPLWSFKTGLFGPQICDWAEILQARGVS
jgi:hypothetical protein